MKAKRLISLLLGLCLCLELCACGSADSQPQAPAEATESPSPVLSELPEREQMVINLRYFHGLTQERVARILNVSQVQVSRLEKKSLLKLREYL